jgi:hypothetical protein
MPGHSEEYGPHGALIEAEVGFAGRDQFVLIDANTIGSTLGSARRAVRKAFGGTKRRHARVPKKIVVYNMKKAPRVVPVGAVKPIKAAMRKWVLKVGTSLEDESLLDFYLTNVALIEGNKPSVSRLSKNFAALALASVLGASKRGLMGKSEAAAEFERILRAEREDPGSLFDSRELLATLKKIRDKAGVGLKRSKELRLGAK